MSSHAGRQKRSVDRHEPHPNPKSLVDLPMKNARFTMIYTGIRVRDMGKSIRFYTRVLGLKLVDQGKNDEIKGEWAQLKSPGSCQLLELNWYAPESPLYTPWQTGVELDHLCFRVDDLDAALKKLYANGAKWMGGPYTTPGWKMMDFIDPNGICLEIGARASGEKR